MSLPVGVIARLKAYLADDTFPNALAFFPTTTFAEALVNEYFFPFDDFTEIGFTS